MLNIVISRCRQPAGSILEKIPTKFNLTKTEPQPVAFAFSHNLRAYSSLAQARRFDYRQCKTTLLQTVSIPQTPDNRRNWHSRWSPRGSRSASPFCSCLGPSIPHNLSVPQFVFCQRVLKLGRLRFLVKSDSPKPL